MWHDICVVTGTLGCLLAMPGFYNLIAKRYSVMRKFFIWSKGLFTFSTLAALIAHQFLLAAFEGLGVIVLTCIVSLEGKKADSEPINKEQRKKTRLGFLYLMLGIATSAFFMDFLLPDTSRWFHIHGVSRIVGAIISGGLGISLISFGLSRTDWS